MFNKLSDFIGRLIDGILGQKAVLAEPGFDPTMEPRRQGKKRRRQWLWIVLIGGPSILFAFYGFRLVSGHQATATATATLPGPAATLLFTTPLPTRERLAADVTRETWTPDVNAPGTITPDWTSTASFWTATATLPASATWLPTGLPIVRYINPPDPVIIPSPTVDASFNNLISLFPTRTPFPASMQTLMAILPTYTPYPTYTPFPTSTPRPPTAYPAQATYTPLPTFTPIVPTQTPWIVYITVEVTRIVEVTAIPSETPIPSDTPAPTETPTETPTPP
jgi:hypothetical protein